MIVISNNDNVILYTHHYCITCVCMLHNVLFLLSVSLRPIKRRLLKSARFLVRVVSVESFPASVSS